MYLAVKIVQIDAFVEAYSQIAVCIPFPVLTSLKSYEIELHPDCLKPSDM